jgi:hypothetical protein
VRRVFGKRLRPTDELLEDPAFPFQVGRIIGASELVAHWLSMQPSEESKAMGNRLASVLDFYYVPESEKASSVRVRRRDEDDTTIITP